MTEKIDNNLASCCGGIVVECKDNYLDILNADREIALLTANGIQVWVDVSLIENTDVIMTVRRFCNTATETGGELNIIININHPQFHSIIRMTEARKRLTVVVDQTFMQALADNTLYNGVEVDSTWNHIARCNILFDDSKKAFHCSENSFEIDLQDCVGNDGETPVIDTAMLEERYKEAQVQCTLQNQLFLSNILAAGEAEEPIRAIINDAINTSRHVTGKVIVHGRDSMLQSLGLVAGNDEANAIINEVDMICSDCLKVEYAPIARGIRTTDHKTMCIKAWLNGCNEFSVSHEDKNKGNQHYMADEEHILKRPLALEADVVRFQNKKEKWIAFIGLIDGRPYEIFTGIADDEEGIFCPKSVTNGKIIKAIDENGQKRYDFQFINKRGFKTTIEGLSEKFNPEYWNYAKLISGVLRYGMPLEQVVKLVSSLQLDSQSINNWNSGVVKALKKYLPDAND